MGAEGEDLVEGRDYVVEDGLLVFTAAYLERRGHCCRSGCRHCPYGYVPDAPGEGPDGVAAGDDGPGRLPVAERGRVRGPLLLVATALLAVLPALPGCGGGDDAPAASPYCASTRSLPAGLRAGPHVIEAEPTAFVVVFQTERAGRGAVGLTPPGGPTRLVEGRDGLTRHRIALAGLPAGARVLYDVRLDGAVLGGPHAVTLPADDPAAAVRIAAVGDVGTGCPPALAIAEAILAEDPDLVLVPGDAAYGAGRPDEVRDRFLAPLQALMAAVPTYVALGNHDVRTDDGAPLLDVLELPEGEPAGGERYYSLDRGPVHVVALDTTEPTGRSGAMYAWLEADLQATRAPWTIVFFHHPPYGHGRHGADPELQRDLVPLLERHGVDLVLCGHDHVYTRFFPLVGGVPSDVAQEPDYVDPAGPVYVTTGGGAHLYEANEGPDVAVSVATNHHVLVTATADTLELEARDLDGRVIDRMTLRPAGGVR